MSPDEAQVGGVIVSSAQVRNFNELICIVSLDQSQQR